MTDKEKIKAYDEALEKAKEILEMTSDKSAIYTIFPELTESKDEKIRKELLKHLQEGAEGYEPAGGTEDYSRWLAWIERQGERKTPQWMIDFLNKHRCHLGASMDWDERRETEGKILAIMDWLKGNPNIEQKPAEQQMYWTEEDEKMFEKVILHVKKYQQIANPANETGESDLTDWIKSIKGRVQPKPEWSKEDEERLGSCIFCTQALAVENHVDSANTAWLKSIKGRVQPQNRWKPSEAQMNSITCAVKKMKESACYDSELVSLFNDLKKLKEG